MGKNTGTVHHCVGEHKDIKDLLDNDRHISAGNCRPVKIGSIDKRYCDKHERLCTRGLNGQQCVWHILKNQWGCLSCTTREAMLKRRADADKLKAEQLAKKNAKNAWYKDDSKGRKGPKNPPAPPAPPA